MLFYLRKNDRGSNHKSRWPLILFGAVSLLVVIILCVHETRMAVCGDVQNYQQLKKVKAMGQYLELFPQDGKKFYYWCHRGYVFGVYEITEPDFTKWAEHKDWKLQEASRISETFEIPQPDGHDTLVQIKDGLYYQKQIQNNQTHLNHIEGKWDTNSVSILIVLSRKSILAGGQTNVVMEVFLCSSMYLPCRKGLRQTTFGSKSSLPHLLSHVGKNHNEKKRTV